MTIISKSDSSVMTAHASHFSTQDTMASAPGGDAPSDPSTISSDEEEEMVCVEINYAVPVLIAETKMILLQHRITTQRWSRREYDFFSRRVNSGDWATFKVRAPSIGDYRVMQGLILKINVLDDDEAEEMDEIFLDDEELREEYVESCIIEQYCDRYS